MANINGGGTVTINGKEYPVSSMSVSMDDCCDPKCWSPPPSSHGSFRASFIPTAHVWDMLRISKIAKELRTASRAMMMPGKFAEN